MILIDAVYIHESGGKTLLEFLVKSVSQKNIPFRLLLDSRLKSAIIEEQGSTVYTKINPSEKERAIYYKKLPANISTVFCFANVPPPVTVDKHIPVYIFFQNTLLLSGLFDKNHYSFSQKISFLAKQFYLRLHNKKQYHWIVQTASMYQQVKNVLHINQSSVSVIPFYQPISKQTDPAKHKDSQFIYVADGVPQKNHSNLLKAWEILAGKYSVKPELHLTVPDRFSGLTDLINSYIAKGLKITNHKLCSKNELMELYQGCSYLVFPSLAESFGLPLIEAANAGCGIIASDLPYVYDVVKPTSVFNPFDPESIAASVIESIKTLVPAQLVVQNQVNQLIDILHPGLHQNKLA